MQSKATTVAQYLRELPADRRAAIGAVREVILRNLDRDYEECMGYGMIGYAVPHRVFPAGYHCDPAQPLPFAGLASQKGYMSVYLMSAYGDEAEAAWLRQQFAKAGKRLDMGRCCIRFKRLEDLPLEVIGEAIRRVPAKVYVDRYIKVLEGMGKWPPRGGAGAAKAAGGAGATRAREAGGGRATSTTTKPTKRSEARIAGGAVSSTTTRGLGKATGGTAEGPRRTVARSAVQRVASRRER